ncbi:MAG: tyrosine-type recombinase/integrase [Deltaproteobacteria bacterium]|nr:tyrosine-type recombinase/integrase [Deltaproteobacteria bacterium]
MKKQLRDITINPWKLGFETSRHGKITLVIKRWIVRNGKGTNQRHPAENYIHIRDNRVALESYVRRLNAEEFKDLESIEAILDRNAFLSPATIEKFEDHLRTHLTTERRVKHEMSHLRKYVLSPFITKFKLLNPKDWISVEDRWYRYLLEDQEVPKAAFTKKQVVQVANKFMRWLHKDRRGEVPLVAFEGLPEGKLERNERYRMDGTDFHERTFIPDPDWKKIKALINSPSGEFTDIKPWVMLCYHYGLRRAESLGLAYEGTDCVYKDRLEVRRQLKTLSRNKKAGFDLLKTPGRSSPRTRRLSEKRNIPHWLGVDYNDTCDWIESGEKNLMSPSTLSDRWRELMNRLGMDYDIHDLRHTWITKAARTYQNKLIDVRDAAGHKSITTTERYLHDDRTFSNDRVRPRKVS